MNNIHAKTKSTQNSVKIKRGEKSPQLLVNNITVKPLVRGTSDIDRWRDVLHAADKGKRTQLYTLYEDLLLDNVLFDAIDKRIKAITNSEITFTRNDGVEVVMDDLIDSSGFEQLLIEIMLAQFWGVSVLELEFVENKFIVHSLPRKHLRPLYGEVALAENDDRGVSYRDNDFVLEVGQADDLGQILRAAPYVIYKRNDVGDWAEYIEIFGRPIRVFTYETYDEASRIETTRAAEQSGGNPIVVMPSGAGFDVKAGATSGDGEIFDKKRRACNEEILIGLLGQTLTTTQGDTGARALGEVHMQVQDAKHKADRRFVQRILNTKLLPMLEKRGFPVSGGFFYFPEAGEQITLEGRMNLIERASALIPIGAQYVYEVLGIPRPEQDEELVNTPATTSDFNVPHFGDDEPTENFIERIRSFFAEAPALGAMQDIEFNDTDTLSQKVAKRVATGKVRLFDTELFIDQAADLTNAFTGALAGHKPLAAIEVDYHWQDPAVITAMENNLYRFSAGKTIAQIQHLNEAYRKATSFEEFAKTAEIINAKYRKDWARTEYITAGAVAENTSTYQRLAKQTELFPYWEYKTLDDSKVRPEHVVLHGVILPANDPLWRKIYPPNGWRCRCYVVPRMRHEVTEINLNTMRTKVQDYLSSDECKRDDVQGFGQNRAIQGIVFEENQNYVDVVSTNRILNNMSPEDWGASPMTQAMKLSRVELLEYVGTADQWRESRLNKGAITVMAAQDRPYIVDDKSFKIHTSNKYSQGTNNRVRLLSSIQEVLLSPDEVWLNAEKNRQQPNNRNYIKFYQTETIVVCTKTIDGQLVVHSWFSLNKNAEGDLRRGMLIKKAAQYEQP